MEAARASRVPPTTDCLRSVIRRKLNGTISRPGYSRVFHEMKSTYLSLGTSDSLRGVVMNTKRVLSGMAVVFSWVILLTSFASGQSDPLYIQFSPGAVKGALYHPDPPQPQPHVAILVTHRTSNVMGSLTCTEVAKRGFMVLCMNPRSDNNEALVVWETIALDVRSESIF